MSRAQLRRYTSIVLVTVLIGAVLSLIARPAQAAPEQQCAPDQTDPARYCITYDLTLTETPGSSDLTAASPFSMTLSAENTSPGVATDMSTWTTQAAFSPLAVGTTSPEVTPSADLPPDLLIAGDTDGSCTGPAFTDCAAGNGVIRTNMVMNGAIVPVSGIALGTFGITRIVNVVDPEPTPHLVHYRVDLEYCSDTPVLPLGPCTATGTTSFDLTIPKPPAGDEPTMDMTIDTDFVTTAQVTAPICAGGTCTADLDSAVSQFVLNLQGVSSTLSNGTPADQSYTLAKLPAVCGTANGSAVFSTRGATPRAVQFAKAYPITGCPTAAATYTTSGFVATMDATTSVTPVLGRTIAKYMWQWGDPTAPTETLVPTTTHKYKNGLTRTVTLTVVDMQGAVSEPVQTTVKGSSTTVFREKRGSIIRAFGVVAPKHAGKRVIVNLLRKTGGKFRLVRSKQVTLTALSKYSTKFTRPRPGGCRLRAQFVGDADHLSSRRTVTFPC
jgi:hypothetical protein